MTAGRFHVLDISGAPRSRGRAHGEALRRPIAEVRERWRESLKLRFGVAPEIFISTFLAETQFENAMRLRTPALLDELEGLAEASGRPRDETLAFQYMDEEWWFGAMRFRNAAKAANRCSVIASRGSSVQPPILAQNMDLPAFLDGAQTVMRVAGDGDAPGATVLTICGMLGLCGANELGLGVAVNTLWQLPRSPDALPVACVVRGVLVQRTLAEASTWLAETRHASGQHYLIAAPDGFASFEASAHSVAHLPWRDSPSFIHTNHPLDESYSPGVRLADEQNSRARYDTLCALTANRSLDLAGVESALATRNGAHPISVPPNDSSVSTMTFASIAMELRQPPTIQVASGPPCSNPYRPTAELFH